jgi:hypothetical protein
MPPSTRGTPDFFPENPGRTTYLRLSMISSRAARPGRRLASGSDTIGSDPSPESSRKSFFAGST